MTDPCVTEAMIEAGRKAFVASLEPHSDDEPDFAAIYAAMHSSRPVVEDGDAISASKLLEWLERAWPAGSGSDFNQGVVRGFEIVKAQLEHGHIQRHCTTAQASELDALKGEVERKDAALKRIADTPAWGYPDKWETTPSEVRQLARAALTVSPEKPA